MLAFNCDCYVVVYIKHYIDTHKKELGILKALGYSISKLQKAFGYLELVLLLELRLVMQEHFL